MESYSELINPPHVANILLEVCVHCGIAYELWSMVTHYEYYCEAFGRRAALFLAWAPSLVLLMSASRCIWLLYTLSGIQLFAYGVLVICVVNTTVGIGKVLVVYKDFVALNSHFWFVLCLIAPFVELVMICYALYLYSYKFVLCYYVFCILFTYISRHVYVVGPFLYLMFLCVVNILLTCYLFVFVPSGGVVHPT